MIGAILYGYPYFTKGYEVKADKKLELRNILSKDYFLMKSLLAEPVSNGNIEKTTEVIQGFFASQPDDALPYLGMIILNNERKVFTVYMVNKNIDIFKIIGTSYSGIEFQHIGDSPHRLLSLYRVNKNNPMGQKYVEIAFKLTNDKNLIGWIVFQMDMDFVENEYNVHEVDFLEFEFTPNGK